MLLDLQKGISLVIPERKAIYPYCICMYISGESRAVIDFGAGKKAFDEINIKSVDMGIFTHFHPDHTHSSILFENARMFAGQEEAKAYEDQEYYYRLQGSQLWHDFMGERKWPKPEEIAVKLDDIPVQPGFPGIKIDETFADGRIFDLGSIRFRAVHLPGHTSGHYGFYFEKEGLLLSADIDLAYSGPWYGNACSNVGQLIASVAKVKEIEPAMLATSHFRPVTGNIGKQLDRFIGVILEREDRIYEVLKEPYDIHQLAKYGFVYTERNLELMEFWEKVCIKHHLTHLMEKGAIKEIEPGVYRQA